jgi:hypothetical protein
VKRAIKPEDNFMVLLELIFDSPEKGPKKDAGFLEKMPFKTTNLDHCLPTIRVTVTPEGFCFEACTVNPGADDRLPIGVCSEWV